jgi:hypothetical protein
MDILNTLAPWLLSAATGGVPALAATAFKTLADTLGVDSEPKIVEKALESATPEQLAKIKKAEQTFELKMKELGFKHIETLRALEVEETKGYLVDVQDARLRNSTNDKILVTGIIILISFAITVILSLYGSYLLLSGGIQLHDPGIVAAVFGFLGTVVGYLAANAQQVVGYFFGSSKGTGDAREALSSTLNTLGNSLAKKAN